MPTLKVSFPSSEKIDHYDPANIVFTYDYILLENIYSPLIEFDRDGKIIGGLAEQFEWQGSSLVLKIRENVKTADGIPITADDVVMSLKRLLILATATHGNLNSFLCKNKMLSSIDEKCPGLRSDNGRVVLELDRREPSLIPMLASIDFAVIPSVAIDRKSLKIKDYRNTSGPYYVESSDSNQIVLRANKHHYHFSEKIPQEAQLIFLSSIDESSQALKNEKVDLLTTIDQMQADTKLTFLKENPEFNSHITMNLMTIGMSFTNRGIRNISENERADIGRLIRSRFLHYANQYKVYEPTSQLFPIFGEASLDADSYQAMTKKLSMPSPKEVTQVIKIRVGNLKDDQFLFKDLKAFFPNAIIERGGPPAFQKDLKADDEPDVYIYASDFGFLEDFSLVTYQVQKGAFGQDKHQAEQWLKEYQGIESKNMRLEKLKELQLNALQRSIAIPIATGPYVAIARKPWTINLSPFFSNNQLWLIQHQP